MRRLTLVLLAVFSLVLTGCAGSQESSTSVPSDAIVIDVRTPAEFADGHLDGARNIDLSAPDFDEQIAALDPDATYVVYCRSGNRSATAVAAMTERGFSDVTDAGGLDAASASTGLDIVQP